MAELRQLGCQLVGTLAFLLRESEPWPVAFRALGDNQVICRRWDQPCAQKRRPNGFIAVMPSYQDACRSPFPELQQHGASKRRRSEAARVVDPELLHADHGVLVLHA